MSIAYHWRDAVKIVNIVNHQHESCSKIPTHEGVVLRKFGEFALKRALYGGAVDEESLQ